MVVTSPIGDHEPPAFAAIITIQAYFKRSVRSGTSLRNTAMITIAAAKLSNKAEKKKVAKLIYHNSLRLFGVRIYPVTALKPPCLSTISTINMEHITKKSVSETFPK